MVLLIYSFFDSYAPSFEHYLTFKSYSEYKLLLNNMSRKRGVRAESEKQVVAI